jgi:hypothetical protein
LLLLLLLLLLLSSSSSSSSSSLSSSSSSSSSAVGAGNFSLHHRVKTGCSGAHRASYPMGTRVSLLGVRQPGRKADHSPPSSAEVKNAWNYPSTPPVRLHGAVLS